jgi:hypothetical protein
MLDEILIPIDFGDGIYNVKIKPYILPPQSLYSTPKAHALASGPSKWNKQQGLYIYRANRLIQSGGWNGIRTSDEHTKLIRMALFIPHQLEELFQVNVAKKHAAIPRALKLELAVKVASIAQKAQEIYRDKKITNVVAPDQNFSSDLSPNPKAENEINQILIDRLIPVASQKIPDFMKSLYQKCNPDERQVLLRIVAKYFPD